MENRITINSLDELPLAAQWLDGMIKQSGKRIVALDAPMGAGKTTLVAEYCRLRGVEGVTSSPTFALVNEYHSAAGDMIYHFDFYRVQGKREALDMGVFDYFDSGNLCFVEWPEKIALILDECDILHITIDIDGATSRSLTAHF